MQVPSSPKGTRDFYPADMARQDFIFDSWTRTCRRYGFEHFEGPMFEHLEVFTQKSGPEIENQLYSFEDKAGRKIALRPELTPTLARMVAAKGSSLKRPIRWYSIPRVCRYEKMQRGRLREFFQVNMDILGVREVTADAELIAAAIDMMRDLGFDASDFSVHVSSRTLLEELFVFCGVAREACPTLYAALDKKHKVPPEEFDASLKAVCGEEKVVAAVRKALDARTLHDIRAINADLAPCRELGELFGLLDMHGLAEFVEFDIGVVRGLAYYTGIVFELFDKKRSMRAIAGGGRYDNLVKLYGGMDTPAVGFAAGDVVLADLLEAKGIEIRQPPRSQVFVAAFDDAWPAEAIRLAGVLRAEGISVETALRNAGIGKQMEQADTARSLFVVFAGGDEGRQGVTKIKKMATREEIVVRTEELIPTIKGLL